MEKENQSIKFKTAEINQDWTLLYSMNTHMNTAAGESLHKQNINNPNNYALTHFEPSEQKVTCQVAGTCTDSCVVNRKCPRMWCKQLLNLV